MDKLNDLQRDALSEIFNIGVGHAAAALSDMVGEEVLLSVPSISFQTRKDASILLGSAVDKRICGVAQHFDGAFKTDAILMFPEENSLEIVRMMVGETISLEELSEMEQEAMSEIGNIILNACMGTLANVFGSELHGSLPTYLVGTSKEILNSSESAQEGSVLILHIDFTLQKRQIHGYVAFLLDVSSLQDLLQQVDRYLNF